VEKKLYFCDKCGEQVNEAKELHRVIVAQQTYSCYGSTYDVVKISYDLCKSCREKIGLVEERPKEYEEAASLESRLFDIMAELVADVSQQKAE
jgi:hypothetical protein